jgi:hypothetical protein
LTLEGWLDRESSIYDWFDAELRTTFGDDYDTITQLEDAYSSELLNRAVSEFGMDLPLGSPTRTAFWISWHAFQVSSMCTSSPTWCPLLYRVLSWNRSQLEFVKSFSSVKLNLLRRYVRFSDTVRSIDSVPIPVLLIVLHLFPLRVAVAPSVPTRILADSLFLSKDFLSAPPNPSSYQYRACRLAPAAALEAERAQAQQPTPAQKQATALANFCSRHQCLNL